MNKVTHPSVIALMHETLARIPETSSGTYNKTDPTHWSKGSIDAFMKTKTKFTLAYHDCTWGNEIRIYRRDKEIGSFYLTWDRIHNGKHWVNQESVIPRQETKGLLKLLFMLNQYLEPFIRDEDYWDDPMGCPSDYI